MKRMVTYREPDFLELAQEHGLWEIYGGETENGDYYEGMRHVSPATDRFESLLNMAIDRGGAVVRLE